MTCASGASIETLPHRFRPPSPCPSPIRCHDSGMDKPDQNSFRRVGEELRELTEQHSGAQAADRPATLAGVDRSPARRCFPRDALRQACQDDRGAGGLVSVPRGPDRRADRDDSEDFDGDVGGAERAALLTVAALSALAAPSPAATGGIHARRHLLRRLGRSGLLGVSALLRVLLWIPALLRVLLLWVLCCCGYCCCGYCCCGYCCCCG